MPAEYRARIEAARPQLLQSARDQYGLTLNPGPFGISTRAAHQLAAAATAAGFGDRLHRALLDAYWVDGRDISDHAVLAAVAEQVGFGAERCRALLADPAADAPVAEDVAQAQAYNLQAVPATVINQRYLISGAQPLPVMRRYLEQVQSMPAE
jgi:predicted DsbA family dithiol-disulfide isomerase